MDHVDRASTSGLFHVERHMFASRSTYAFFITTIFLKLYDFTLTFWLLILPKSPMETVRISIKDYPPERQYLKRSSSSHP